MSVTLRTSPPNQEWLCIFKRFFRKAARCWALYLRTKPVGPQLLVVVDWDKALGLHALDNFVVAYGEVPVGVHPRVEAESVAAFRQRAM
jgi:hypothetical protein